MIIIVFISDPCQTLNNFDVILISFYFQGDADSGIDRLWQKKKTELKQ
jgi:hypothetical protein